MHYKITIFGASAPYPRLIYWIASSISQGKKDNMSTKFGPCSSHTERPIYELSGRGNIMIMFLLGAITVTSDDESSHIESADSNQT